MPDPAGNEAGHPSKLEISFSRKYFLSVGKFFRIVASVLILVGAFGWMFLSWGIGQYVIVIIITWIAVFFVFAILFGLSGRKYMGWAINGPDLWLRIAPEGLDVPQAAFNLVQHHLAWAELERWNEVRDKLDNRNYQLRSTKGKWLTIAPMEYVWSRPDIKENRVKANALADVIEALLKLHAGDRQGKTIRSE